MRLLICALAAISLSACVPPKPVEADPAAIPPVPKAIASKIDPQVPEIPVIQPKVTVREIFGIRFEGVGFDSRSHRLVVADQPDGPGTRHADAQAAAKSLGGIAAINAGFFTPEGAPLGLVASSGKLSGAWNSSSSLGSGAWHESSAGKIAITRREKLGRSGAAGMRELIQAGPLLVENNRAVGGLESTKSSARSVILWDGGTRWWIGCASPCTLADLGRALATGQPAGWPVRHALNLDGGRSSDLWISDAVPGGPVMRRPPWNRPVRNFLVLRPAVPR